MKASLLVKTLASAVRGEKVNCVLRCVMTWLWDACEEGIIDYIPQVVLSEDDRVVKMPLVVSIRFFEPNGVEFSYKGFSACLYSNMPEEDSRADSQQ